MYKIILSDGTEITDLQKNGDNYVSTTPFDACMFTGNLSPVTIDDGDVAQTHEHMAFVQTTQMGDEYWLVLRDVSASEMTKMQLRADIDYIAMMADVTL